MKIRSLLIPSFLVLGLSLGLSTSAQAGKTHYSAALHGADHGYVHAKQRRDLRHHVKHQRHHCDYRGHKQHSRHYGRFHRYHSDRYRHGHDGHYGQRRHGDHHDKGSRARHRS